MNIYTKLEILEVVALMAFGGIGTFQKPENHDFTIEIGDFQPLGLKPPINLHMFYELKPSITNFID